MLESISAGHWVTRCHLDCASEARNSTLTKFQCIKRHIDPPLPPSPLIIRLSSLLKMKLHKMRDRNTLTAVIYLPNDQVLNYARGTQWNSPDTSLHCWVGGARAELIFFFMPDTREVHQLQHNTVTHLTIH